MLARLLFWVLLVAAPVYVSARAGAEETPGENSALARELFRRGAAAAKAEDWATARTAFSESYELYPSSRTLFNLGVACAELGELVAASESLRAFLRIADPRREARARATAQAELDRIAPKIGRLVIEVSGLLAADEVRLDGRVFPLSALASEVPADPGSHLVTVQRHDQEIARAEVSLEPGAARPVRLVAPAPEAKPQVANATVAEPEHAAIAWPEQLRSAAGADEDDGRRRRRRRWLGALAGVVAAGVGASLAIYYGTRSDNTVEPVRGNVEPYLFPVY